MSNQLAVVEGGKRQTTQMPIIVPETIDDAYRIATAVIQSGLNPPGLKNAQSVMIVIMHGLEIGMKPMQALQNIGVINNKPAIFGDALPALVKGSGICKYIKEWIDGEGDERIAWCETHRAREPEPVRVKFSVTDAKKAKLWGKSGPWSLYQDRMLQMRARSFCLRDVYPDVLSGIGVYEEVRDFIKVEDISEIGDDGQSDKVGRLKPPTPPEPSAQSAPIDVEVSHVESEQSIVDEFVDLISGHESASDIADQLQQYKDSNPDIDDLHTNLDEVARERVEKIVG